MVVVCPLVQHLANVYGYVIPPDVEANRQGAVDLTSVLPSFLEHSRAMCSANVCDVRVGSATCRGWNMVADGGNLVSKGMRLRDGVKLRAYQEDALRCLRDPANAMRLLSGNVRMPCGSGKTPVALCVAMEAEAVTLVVTNSNMASSHFAEQLQQFFIPPTQGVLVVDDTYKQSVRDIVPHRPGIVICTYHTLTSDSATPFTQLLRALPYGLVLLDEAQTSVADNFKRVFNIPTCSTISFSATYYREDAKMDMLLGKVGPMLVNITRESLVSQGFIPDVQRVEVHVPGDAGDSPGIHRGRDGKRKRPPPAEVVTDLVLQPYKMTVLVGLLASHARAGDKMILFCDELMAMDKICDFVRVAVVHFAVPVKLIGPLTMNTKDGDRLSMLQSFRASTGPVVIFMSRVADTAINLPGANILIQTTCHDKSRNRVLQRTGRIQRQGAGTHIAYEIVTQGSVEESNVLERRACMDDEGYSTSILYPFGGTPGGIETDAYLPYVLDRFKHV